MLFTQDRQKLRELFVTSWARAKRGETLEPLEKQLVTLLEEHPEYHALIEDRDKAVLKDFTPAHGEENPFLHLGLHLALREQVGNDAPPGIRDVTRALLLKYQNGHDVEHRMMVVLGETLWDAQRQSREPDQQAYLERLRALL